MMSPGIPERFEDLRRRVFAVEQQTGGQWREIEILTEHAGAMAAEVHHVRTSLDDQISGLRSLLGDLETRIRTIEALLAVLINHSPKKVTV